MRPEFELPDRKLTLQRRDDQFGPDLEFLRVFDLRIGPQNHFVIFGIAIKKFGKPGQRVARLDDDFGRAWSIFRLSFGRSAIGNF